MTRKLVAVFARTQFMEGIGRYERLFKPNPPTIIAQFTERVPIVKGRLSATASTATSYAWFVWRTDQDNDQTELVWIPPSRRIFEKNADYAQVWKLHILDPRVTPRKQTFLEKLKENN